MENKTTRTELESLKEEVSEIREMLFAFEEAFWRYYSQGKVCHARDAIHAVRVCETIFARRTRNATCLEAGELRDELLNLQCDLAVALDWVEASLIDMMRKWKGDETLHSQQGSGLYDTAMENFNEATKISTKIYALLRDKLMAAA